MIYIIAGIAKSGKSIVAHDMLKFYHIHVISTDWIMMMLYNSNQQINIDVNLSDASVSASLEPYIAGLIQSYIDTKSDFVIEGVHVQPEFAKKLLEKYPDKLKVVFLGYKDMDPHVKCIELKTYAHQISNPWYIHKNDQELLHLTTYLQKESEKLYNTCVKFNQTYFEINDIMTDKKAIIQALMTS
jgi:hypothetical protein